MIPAEFQLSNREWRVKWITDRTMRKKNNDVKAWGTTFADKCIIYLNKELLDEGNEDLLMHTWEHELSHALLFAYGVSGDQHDEKEIDGVAGLRCQFYQTLKGGDYVDI